MWQKYKKTWIFLIFLISFYAIYQGYQYYRNYQEEQAYQSNKAKTQKMFKPVLDIFDQNIQINKQSDSPYDIDKTIRVIHEIDHAIAETDNLESYLMMISKQDYRHVAPEILQARKELLKTIMEIYAHQTRLKDQPDYWDMIREYTLAASSGINPSGLTSPLPTEGIKYDPEMTKRTYEEYLESKKVSEEIKAEIRKQKAKLLSQLYEYSSIYYKYYDEWDRLCLHRDKAYLASKSMQWDVVKHESELAIQKAPFEKEAHILKGLAMVASMPDPNAINVSETPVMSEDPLPFLESFIQQNPNYSAPALLLKGVYYQRKGDLKQAKLNFEESAAMFPKQSDQLLNNFDPYKMRSYLRKSKEGNIITEAYKTTMLGGGFFTPDLQLAKLYYASNNPEMGKNKVLDHFARRRNQSQWDYIISDIQFCENAFGNDFKKILPENHFLELKVDPALWGNDLNLIVKNNSTKRLNNASLILCIQFTDMMRDDYIAIKVDKTLPALLPGEENDFGSQEIVHNIFGKEKGVDDIVLVRAIVISDEAVNWVDTDDFKYEYLKREREKLAKMPKNQKDELANNIGFNRESLIKLIKENAKISVTSSKLSLNDQIHIDLPKQLAFLSPIFKLSNSGKIDIQPSENMLDQNAIKLNFKINKFSNDKSSYTSKIYTRFGDIDIKWGQNALGRYEIKDISFN